MLSEHYYKAVVDHLTDWKSVSTLFMIVLYREQMQVCFNILFSVGLLCL
jgi:hypothetical protein